MIDEHHPRLGIAGETLGDCERAPGRQAEQGEEGDADRQEREDEQDNNNDARSSVIEAPVQDGVDQREADAWDGRINQKYGLDSPLDRRKLKEGCCGPQHEEHDHASDEVGCLPPLRIDHLVPEEKHVKDEAAEQHCGLRLPNTRAHERLRKLLFR
jgi:hypothetical protein